MFMSLTELCKDEIACVKWEQNISVVKKQICWFYAFRTLTSIPPEHSDLAKFGFQHESYLPLN